MRPAMLIGVAAAMLLPTIVAHAHPPASPSDAPRTEPPAPILVGGLGSSSGSYCDPTARLAHFVGVDASLARTPAPITPWLENFSVLGGIDGAKGPEDLGVSANFGFRAAMQTSGPLVADWGLGLQLGTGVDYHRNATRFLRLLMGARDRNQWFSTIGIFQRTESGFIWGIAYDFLTEHSYTSVELGQWRAQIGYQLNENNEIGVWGTLRDFGDSARVGTVNFSYQPINQYAIYLRHIWPTGVMTRGW